MRKMHAYNEPILGGTWGNMNTHKIHVNTCTARSRKQMVGPSENLSQKPVLTICLKNHLFKKTICLKIMGTLGFCGASFNHLFS